MASPHGSDWRTREGSLHRNGTIRSLVVFGTVVFLFLTGCSRHAEQPETKTESKPSPATAQAKEIWVSETTGKEYRVRAENDVVRAEWLNVSPELATHGAFIRSECKREGAKWVGTSSSYLPCTMGSGPKPTLDNWCHLDTKFEIDSIAPDSITGRGEALISFDCMKCKILKSEMKDFLWSPKEAIPQ